MNQISLPHLSIAEVSTIYPYEWLQNVESSPDLEIDVKTVQHPFPVTPLDETDYLLLGDTDLFRRLAEDGLPCVPVQICPSEQVTLESLPVGLSRFQKDDLVRFAGKHVDTVSLDGSPGGGQGSVIRVSCEFEDGPVQLSLRDSTRTGCPTPLDLLFREIARNGRFLPSLDRRNRRDSLTRAVNLSGRMELPEFDLDDLKAAARSERLFPAGLINCRLKRRVLHIDFPTEILAAEISLTEKQQYLSELVSLRFRSSRTSFYDGQIFLLNR